PYACLRAGVAISEASSSRSASGDPDTASGLRTSVMVVPSPAPGISQPEKIRKVGLARSRDGQGLAAAQAVQLARGPAALHEKDRQRQLCVAARAAQRERRLGAAERTVRGGGEERAAARGAAARPLGGGAPRRLQIAPLALRERGARGGQRGLERA